MQTNVAVSNGKVTGTLKYVDSGALAHDWGAGNFLVLKWTDPDQHAESLKVGLNPSEGSGLIECIDDTDRNGVFKITDPEKQKFIVLSAGTGYGSTRQEFDLSELVLQKGE